MTYPGLAAALLLATVLQFCVTPGTGRAESVLHIGAFSKLTPGAYRSELWQPLTFKKIKRHTVYRVVNDDKTTVLQADSHNAASGLIRKVSIDPYQFPYISWRWKVSGVYAKGDVSRKTGDDYPARVYITFKYDPSRVGFLEKAKFKAARMLYAETPPLAAISYIWGNRAKEGKTVPNAYTDRVKMVILQSGASRANQWVTEKRNVYADYKQAFGEEPPMISGVAVMTDSDNTGESGRAWYGDIVFSAE